jgi:hypothetical protein
VVVRLERTGGRSHGGDGRSHRADDAFIDDALFFSHTCGVILNQKQKKAKQRTEQCAACASDRDSFEMDE